MNKINEIKNPRRRIGKIMTNKRKFMLSTVQGDFVSACDGITFGIINDGTPFDSGPNNWKIEDKIKWAKSSALFFEHLALRFNSFAIAVEKQNKNAINN